MLAGSLKLIELLHNSSSVYPRLPLEKDCTKVRSQGVDSWAMGREICEEG